jgi:histone-lysine N-methyltransferase SETMAR
METKLNTFHETVRTHLQKLGKVLKEGVRPFLDQIVTGDEKWILYVNIKRKKQWLSRGQKPVPTAKPDLHPQKIMLCIWWDMRGVIHFELLNSNQTITSELYCQQLDRLNQSLVQNHSSLVNRKGVLLHDNARPHVARLTEQKIRELGWEVLPHPPYSPDMAPTDYHLFRSLQHYLNGKEYEKEIKQDITLFIESKPPKFFKQGIENLVK